MNYRNDGASSHFGSIVAGAKDELANAIQIDGAAASGVPTITAVGDDTNISLKLVPKGSGSITFNGNEGNNGTITLAADDGDDTADRWSVSALAASATLQLLNAATTDAPINFAAGSISVIGTEAGDASLILDADNGDNAGDTWTIKSDATTNSLIMLNEAVQAVSVSSAGLVTATAGLQSTSATVLSGYATGAGGAQTQATDATTTVVLSKPCGQITTVALTTAAAAEEVFQLTNTLLAATDVVCVSTTYAGAGTPIVSVKGVAAGSCKIVITNVHATDALNAVLVVNFAVIKAVAA